MRYLIDTNVLANFVVHNYISNDVRAIISDFFNETKAMMHTILSTQASL